MTAPATRSLPLRAAFVSHYPHLRMGGQRSMALLIEHLDRAVVLPLAICPGPGELTDHLERLGCPVIHIPLHPIKPRTALAVWRSIRQIRAVLKRESIDIIAPDAERDTLVCGLAKLGTQARLAWFVALTRPDRNLDPILERLADGIIGVSDDTRRRFSDTPRISARYRTILGGADLRRFHPAADRAALRQTLGLPVDRPVLLYVGQVTEAKGVLDIVEALRLLYQGPHRPLLLVVGTPHPPGFEAEIARRATTHGTADAVRVLPQQPDIERWMQAADIVISGSHDNTEGMSRVLYEAMACGAALVATDIRGNRDAVFPDSGVLVPERDPAAMAHAVAGLLAAPARLQAMGAAGARRARSSFDIHQHARNVEAFFTYLAGEAGGSITQRRSGP